MIKCSPEAFAKCPTHQYCGSSHAECDFSEGSDCDVFNQQVESETSPDAVRNAESILQGKEMLYMPSPPDLYNPSQWRRYDFKICHGSQSLASMLDKINENGWVLVAVTQYRRRSYTVFFKRFVSCLKKDDA